MNGFGQNFDDFMLEQGLYDEAKELAAKKLIVEKRCLTPGADNRIAVKNYQFNREACHDR
jgi:hypothetical protein